MFLTDAPRRAAVAWALALAVPALAQTTIIVDNADPGFSVVLGTWDTQLLTGQYGADCRSRATATSTTGRVAWTPTIPTPGQYEVAVWYPPTSDAPNNARYTVNHAGGSQNVSIDQQANGGAWNVLGTWSFTAGSSGSVTLSNLATKNKTVVADAVRFTQAVDDTPEFRGAWADVFHVGLQTASQIDTMIGLLKTGNYNAMVPEVLAYHDNQVGSHGAYWRSDLVARSSYVTESFDPLAYMIQQGHANGIEVHPWLVAFRVSSVWPPPGHPTLADHPDWLMVPEVNMGTVAPVGSYYTFDPGNPQVQEYLVSVVRELVSKYAIDGIHWDYIRYTQTDCGYPTDVNSPNSSLARFRRIYNRTDIPGPTDPQWCDFRRRTITELVRRLRAEIPTIANPRQPLRYSAALVTWSPANTNFHLTRPYYETFSDWEYWASLGYLDATVPMAYFDEDGAYTQTYRAWVTNSVTWAYDRATFTGPGIYMNSFANSLVQMQYARSAGVDGFVTYSYNVTNDTSTPYQDWYPFIAANFFTQPVATPPMPWRSSVTATEGTLFGQVLNAQNGLPEDDATVTVGGQTIQTDANGYYVATLLPATAAGTPYTLTAIKSPWTMVSVPDVQVVAGEVRRQDITIAPPVAPTIIQQPVGFGLCPGTSGSFTVSATGTEPLSYQWVHEITDLTDGGPFSGATTSALTVDTSVAPVAGRFRCVVTNAAGSDTSEYADLYVKTPPTFLFGTPASAAAPVHTPVSFTVSVRLTGTPIYQWQHNGVNLANDGRISGANSATLTIANINRGDLGEYRCVVVGDCGPRTSDPATLTFSAAPVDYDGDGDVDSSDFGHLQACLSGSLTPQNEPTCQDTRLDADEDVDELEVGWFVGCLSGPGVPAVANCAG